MKKDDGKYYFSALLRHGFQMPSELIDVDRMPSLAAVLSQTKSQTILEPGMEERFSA